MAMSTLTSVGPMLIMDGARPALPQAIPSAAQCIVPQTPIGQYMTANGAAFQHHLAAYRGGPPAPSSAASANGSGSGSSPAPNATSTSMNRRDFRSQRCGVCRGCQCKPCGNCTYCQDSPQFGGPGVKKQSCIERRCLRVLENRLQRDVPGFKARAGCNNCDDCRMPDCQICLVCLDRRFFDNRYMPGALCAKKRCNNATSLELPPTPGSATERQGMKRSFDNSHDYTSKRRGVDSNGATHSALGGMQVSRVGSAPTQDAVLYAGAPPHLQTLRVLPPPPPHALAAAAHHMKYGILQLHNNLLVPMGAVPTSTPYGDPSGQPAVSQAANGDENPASSNGSTTNGHSNPLQTAPLLAFQPPNGSIYAPFGFPPAGAPLDAMAAAAAAGGLPPHLVNPYQAPKIFNYPKYEYYENDSSASPQDPFVPPSYAPEMKNAVVLQPL